MEFIVYKHTSPTNKIYVGITSQNPIRRWSNGHGYKNNKYFTNAITKYGWNNFRHEILYTNLTKEEAEQKEIELIAKYKSNDIRFGYNIENGGFSNGKHSIITKQKISLANSGKRFSEEHKRNLRLAKLGKQLSDEHKMRLKETHKGMSGKHHSFESKLKMTVSHQGVPINNSQKQRISESLKKPVKCLETGKIYDSAKNAEIELKIGHHIGECCKNPNKRCGGYHWEYVNGGEVMCLQ